LHGQRHADRGVQYERVGNIKRVVLGERVGSKSDTGVNNFQFQWSFSVIEEN